MNEKYYPPIFKKEDFHCPHCEVFAHQYWSQCYVSNCGWNSVKTLYISTCAHCNGIMVWYMEKPVYPRVSSIPMPHFMMPEGVSKIYSEAREIASDSPRSAAALLRLALQTLLKEIGGDGSIINDDIGKLLKRHVISPRVQQACDILRVTGNNAVHPGTIDVDDNLELTIKLFDLINFIVKETIETPSELDELFNNLPNGAKKGIEARDKTVLLTGKTK